MTLRPIRALQTLAAVACLAVVACAPALFAAETASSHSNGFKKLFDGTTLDGWVQRGGKAEYRVEDGMVVGKSVQSTPNSFLCTKETYGDFILELDFKVDPVLNSGVQIRSEVYEKDTEVEIGGRKSTRKAGVVFGYQVEIDPSERAWTAGIYDESRRGWLNDLKDNPMARAAFKQNDWNHFRIECRDDSIKTWLNGVPAADLTDSMTPKGLIALQVHGVGNDESKVGKEVRWKNIRIKVLD